MKTCIAFFLILATSGFISPKANGQSPDRLQAADLQPLTGSWSGVLTYLDYTYKKDVSIQATLRVKPAQQADTWYLTFGYPGEPSYGGTDTVQLSADGKTWNDARVISKKKQSNGELIVISEREGMDDEKPATIRYTMTLSGQALIIRKDVRFSDSAEFLRRNEYRFARVNS